MIKFNRIQIEPESLAEGNENVEFSVSFIMPSIHQGMQLLNALDAAVAKINQKEIFGDPNDRNHAL